MTVVAMQHKYSVETMSSYLNLQGKHTMFIDFLTAYLTRSMMQREFGYTHESEVDRYISSKNPQTTADVEHWEREYSRQQQNQGWLL